MKDEQLFSKETMDIFNRRREESLQEETIQLPIAWIKRLKDYTNEMEKDNFKDSHLNRLLGYLESLDMFLNPRAEPAPKASYTGGLSNGLSNGR